MKIGTDVENMRFNTAISQMMIFTNHLITLDTIPISVLETFVKLVSPFIPHVAEELWEYLGHNKSIAYEPWPEFDKELAKEELITIAIQVNGKLRANIEIPSDSEKCDVLLMAKENNRIKAYLDGNKIIKEIYVPGRLVNFVVI